MGVPKWLSAWRPLNPIPKTWDSQDRVHPKVIFCVGGDSKLVYVGRVAVSGVQPVCFLSPSAESLGCRAV